MANMIGIMPLNRALFIAKDLELDLIEVAPEANPPVCRIIDFGRYKYEQQKREKKSEETAENSADEGDDIQAFNRRTRFWSKDKAYQGIPGRWTQNKNSVRFKRMELAHKERGNQLIARIEKELENVGKVVRPAYMFGKDIIMVLAPTEIRKEKDAQTKNEEVSS